MQLCKDPMAQLGSIIHFHFTEKHFSKHLNVMDVCCRCSLFKEQSTMGNGTHTLCGVWRCSFICVSPVVCDRCAADAASVTSSFYLLG